MLQLGLGHPPAPEPHREPTLGDSRRHGAEVRRTSPGTVCGVICLGLGVVMMRPPSVHALARSLVDMGLPHPLLVDVARAAIAAAIPSRGVGAPTSSGRRCSAR